MVSEEFLKSLVGMSQEAAEKTITEAKLTCRVVSKDGEDFMGTTDFDENRVGITVKDGNIVVATCG